jgi:putative two-component system response regulator
VGCDKNSASKSFGEAYQLLTIKRTPQINIQPRKILIVDDDAKNCELLRMMLQAEDYEVRIVSSGEAALASIELILPDLILLDVMMPGMNGNKVVGILKHNPKTQSIPVIMVSALISRDAKMAAFTLGAEEFVSKPVDRAELLLRVRNMLRLKDYNDLLSNYNKTLQAEVQERTSELENAYQETILTMVRAAEYKDEDTGRHVQRISYYAAMLGKLLGLDEKMVLTLKVASPMHDIGKIGIPDNILFKTTPFTPEEWTTMQTHSALGAKILENGTSPYTKMGAEIALNHHEKWDGSGYPNGLSGKAIPLSARIMSLCDVYDALRSKRPYKPAFSHEKTLKIILEGDGRTQPEHFDPAVLAAFASHPEHFDKIYENYKNA